MQQQLKGFKKSPSNIAKASLKADKVQPYSQLSSDARINSQQMLKCKPTSLIKEADLIQNQKPQQKRSTQAAVQHHSNKSASSISGFLKTTGSFGPDQQNLEVLYSRQQALENELKEYERQTSSEIDFIKDKFETQEQLFSKFLKLMFDKYYQLEGLITNQESMQSSNSSEIDQQVKILQTELKSARLQSAKLLGTESGMEEIQDINMENELNTKLGASSITKYQQLGRITSGKGNTTSSNRNSGGALKNVSQNSSFLDKNHQSQSIFKIQPNATQTHQKLATQQQDNQQNLNALKACLPHVVVSLEQRKKAELSLSQSAKEPSRIMPTTNITQTTSTTIINRSTSSKIFNPLPVIKQITQINQSTFNLEKKKYLQNTDLKNVSSQKDLIKFIPLDNQTNEGSDYFATNEYNERSPQIALNNSLMDQQINLRNNYQKHIPHHKKMQRPHTQLQKRSLNATYQVQMGQNSMLNRPHLQKDDSVGRMSDSGSQSTPSVKGDINCKSMIHNEDMSCSPKFIGHLKKSSKKYQENLLQSNYKEFKAEQKMRKHIKSLSTDKNLERKMYDTILSREDFGDFDEGKIIVQNRVPQKKEQKMSEKENQANCVYQSKNMNLSRFISSNKSQIDFKNYYNQVEFRNVTEIMKQKGSKCQCASQKFKDISNKRNNTDITSETCGELCKRLTPNQQREIIKRLFLLDSDEQYNNKKGSPNEKILLVPCSRSRSPNGKPNNLNASALGVSAQSEKRYLINAKWWRQWTDYVNFEAQTPKCNHESLKDCTSKLNIVDQRKGILRNLQEVLMKEDSMNQNSIYQKPGVIKNENLLIDSKSSHLKENLVEHFDFVVVSGEIWKYLYSWYSTDQPIVRFLKRDITNKKTYYLDLYPEKKPFNNMNNQNDSEILDSETESKNTIIEQQLSKQMKSRAVALGFLFLEDR